VFRTNLGWQRYWEAITQLHIMYSKWGDAYTQLVAFADVTVEHAQALGTEEGDSKSIRVQTALTKLLNNFSLLSAVSAHRLTHGDTQRMEKRAEMTSWRHQIVLRGVLRTQDLTGATKMPSFAIRRSMSDQALGDGHANAWTGMAYLVSCEPTEEELEVLSKSSDRPSLVMYWIIHDLVMCSQDLEIASPIQSRMYQELSNGMLGLNQACKLADIPFPFPFAQMLTGLLVIYCCFIPVYITLFTSSYIAAPILSFLLFQGIWGLNETAKELENPFGADVNDIKLVDFHNRFVDLCKEVYEAHTTRSGDRGPMNVSMPLLQAKSKSIEMKAVMSEAKQPLINAQDCALEEAAMFKEEGLPGINGELKDRKCQLSTM